MADNKQYISQPQENGSVKISEDVLSTIISHTISEVEGVSGMASKPGIDITELIGKKNWNKGMKVTIGENDELYIDCNIIVLYGHSVVTIAKTVQESVTAALESMAGVRVEAVNVNICGIVRQ